MLLLILNINASNKRRNVGKDCGAYLREAFIPGRRLMIFLLVPAAFFRMQWPVVTQSPFAELSKLKPPNKVKYFLN